MNNQEWQDLHNDNGRDDSERDQVTVTTDIEWGTSVLYECTAEVQLFRGIPCRADVFKMKRIFLDDDGIKEDSVEELCPSEFPHFIKVAAEKKLVEDI